MKLISIKNLVIFCFCLIIVPLNGFSQKRKKKKEKPSFNYFLDSGLLIKGADYQEFKKILYGIGVRRFKESKIDKISLNFSKFKDITGIFDRESVQFYLKYSRGKSFWNFMALQPYVKLSYENRNDIQHGFLSTDRNFQYLTLGADLEFYQYINDKIYFSIGLEVPAFGASRSYQQHTFVPAGRSPEIIHYDTSFFGIELISFVNLGVTF